MAAQQMLWAVLLVSACFLLTSSAAAEEAGKDPANMASSNSKDYYDEPYRNEEHKHFYDRLWDSHYCPPCHCEPPIAPPQVCLNPTTKPTENSGFPTESVMSARYRLANNGWDMGIAPGGDPVLSQFQVDIISNNDKTALNNVLFDFELLYGPLSGYTWTLRDPSGGQFAGPYSTQWSPADGCFSSGQVCTGSPVYGIQLRVQATQPANSNPTSMTVTDLSFEGSTIQGVTVCGSLPSGLSASAGNTPKTQWILSDSDLSQISWAVRGKVTGVKDQTSSDEGVKFDIYTVPLSALEGSECGVENCTAAPRRGRQSRG